MWLKKRPDGLQTRYLNWTSWPHDDGLPMGVVASEHGGGGSPNLTALAGVAEPEQVTWWWAGHGADNVVLTRYLDDIVVGNVEAMGKQSTDGEYEQALVKC